jgi:hypothetical protein
MPPTSPCTTVAERRGTRVTVVSGLESNSVRAGLRWRQVIHAQQPAERSSAGRASGLHNRKAPLRFLSHLPYSTLNS